MVPRPRTRSADTEDHQLDGEIYSETSDGLRHRRQNSHEDEVSSISRSKSPPLSRNLSSRNSAQKRHSYGLGKLRFRKAHGMLGVLSLPIVLWALYNVHTTSDIYQHNTSTTVLAVTLAILSTTALAISAIPLLKQVPKCTIISKRWNVIPPHKEAFRRTIAIVGYLDLRLTSELLKVMMSILSHADQQHQVSSLSQEDWQRWFSKALSVYYFWFFLPRGSFGNGNTWVFVVPMFLGFGVDVYHQDPSAGVPWNEKVVTVEYLLLTLLSAQVVAFMFTLGFRNIVPIRYGYWIAALVVFSLCAGMGFNYYNFINLQL